MLPPIAIVRFTDQVVQGFRADVVEHAIRTVRSGANVLLRNRFPQEVFVQLPAVSAYVHQKLAPDEITAVESCRDQEPGLALCVPGSNEVTNSFFVCHRFQIEISPATISGSSSAGLLGALLGA